MRFPDSFLEEIRARLPISQVVGRHVQFDRKRSRPSRGDYWACCPFHHEKTPSFHVDDRKGYYYCFGCHAKGDHFRFLVDKEGLSFTEAVERLAHEAGLELPRPDPARERREERRLGLMEVLEATAAFYERQLMEPAGAEARAYAERRGLSPDTIATFRIGAAPDARDALYRHLRTRGVDDALMAEAGLIAVPEDGGKPYDRFRHRLMFPIRDARGRVIAFGGRALGEARAKYLNSPETPVFHKSHVLFNLDLARKPAFERGEVVAVEGYMDVIAMHQAGFPHTVAPLGTALTESQLTMLWRLAAQPVLCFDGDAAGRKAAWRALETALPHLKPGHSLRFAFLPEGLDPDDLVRQRGPGALADVLDHAEPLIDVLFRHVCARHKTSTPEERAALEADVEALAARIGEPKVRQHYRAELRERLNGLFGRGGFRGRGGTARGQRGGNPRGKTRFAPAPPPSAELLQTARGNDPLGPLAEQDLLRIILLRPDIIPDIGEALADFPFSTPELDSLARAVLDIATTRAEEPPLDPEALLAHLRARGHDRTCQRLLKRDARRRLAKVIGGAVEQVVADFLHRMEEMRRRRRLCQELEEARAAFAAEASEENLLRLAQVRAELDALERLNE